MVVFKQSQIAERAERKTSHPASKTSERSQWVRMHATGNTSIGGG